MCRSWPRLSMLLSTILMVPALSLAAETLPGPPEITQQDTGHGPLDGMAFQGKLAPADDPDDGRADTLYFRNGYFWSAICIPCGFKPARYWVRTTAEGIHFRGVLQSPTGGTFQYRGIVNERHVSVRIDWRKERWYWTINREFRFEGSLRQGADPLATLESAQATAISALQSGIVCEPG